MNITKKILALCLTILMIFSVTSIAYAADETDNNLTAVLPRLDNIDDLINFPLIDGIIVEDTKQTCPVITIPGFTASPVYDDINDESTLIGFPDTDDILAIVTEAFIPALLRYAVDRDIDKLVVPVTDRVNEAFAYWFNESTGDAKEGSGIIPQDLSDVTIKSDLTFTYDWRGDPVKIADNLNAYIDEVCRVSDSDKVALACHSLGSTIALSYLTFYGNDKIESIVFDSPACNGVAIMGSVLTGNVNFDAESIGYFLKNILGENEYKALLSSIIDILESAGVMNLVVRFADEIVEALAPAVYRETVAPLMGYWPTVWSMVPDNKVAEAKAYIFDNILASKDLSVLESKIDYYNTTVRANRTKTLKSFDSDGNFAIISRYTHRTIPLEGSAKFMSDLMIETSASSFGATTTPMGEYFSDDYLKGKDMAYISPDRTVDASTCLFPDKTWFIRDSGHFETGALTEDYYDMFLFAEEELTCDTAEIGRFTYRDPVSYTLVEDTAVPSALVKSSLYQSIYSFAVAFVETIVKLIENLF